MRAVHVGLFQDFLNDVCIARSKMIYHFGMSFVLKFSA